MLVTEFAMPTTVSTWLPTVIVEPTWAGPPAFTESTTWLSLVGQWPCCRVRSSTGPPGEERPTRVSGTPIVPSTPGRLTCAVTLCAGERPGDGGDAAHVRGVRQLRGGGGGGVHGDGHVRAVLRRERVVERAVRVGEHAEGERGGGGGDEDDQADDDGLEPPAAEAAARGAERRHS